MDVKIKSRTLLHSSEVSAFGIQCQTAKISALASIITGVRYLIPSVRRCQCHILHEALSGRHGGENGLVAVVSETRKSLYVLENFWYLGWENHRAGLNLDSFTRFGITR